MVVNVKRPISAATEFLNSYQVGKNSSMSLGIMLKNNDTSKEKISYS
jgi:hypothetical protein